MSECKGEDITRDDDHGRTKKNEDDDEVMIIGSEKRCKLCKEVGSDPRVGYDWTAFMFHEHEK